MQTTSSLLCKTLLIQENVKGVVLRINSPGGSPVQASQIYQEIKRQKKLHASIPIIAVIDDLGASGGYYIASAADKIYADQIKYCWFDRRY